MDMPGENRRSRVLRVLTGGLWGRRRRRAAVRADPAQASTAEIGRAWERTSVELGRCRSVPDRLRLIHERQSYLDELARRDSTGLIRWGEHAIAGRAVGPEVFIERVGQGDGVPPVPDPADDPWSGGDQPTPPR
jgi:hypothetical protein